MDQVKTEMFKKFVNYFKQYYPEDKDYLRASTCKNLAAAYRQMRAIKDFDKFFRRLKAFLLAGFKVTDLSDTIMSHVACEEVEQWLETVEETFAANMDLGNARICDEHIRKKMDRLCDILCM